MKKIHLSLLLPALTVLAGSVAADNAPASRMPARPRSVVGAAKVVNAQDVDTRHYTGQVVSQAVVQIVPRISGEILEVGFKDGSQVKKGQLLYRLDPVQYEAAVKSAEAKIAQCRAHLQYAQENFERNDSLFKKDAASRDEMENTRSQLEAYRAQLMAAEAELIVAKDNLKNTRIVSPVDAIAGVTNFTLGNYITPSSGVLVTLIQVEPIRVRFSISTGDYLSMFGNFEELCRNASIRIRLADGTTYPTEGKVEFINNEANQRTDTIQIYSTFPNQDHRLIPGSTVGVTLSRRKGTTMPGIAPSAIMHTANGSYVYVLDKDNKVERRMVVLGNSTPDLQLIREGVKAGETVITKGTHKTMPGDVVEVQMAE